jgi:hypothetical protein
MISQLLLDKANLELIVDDGQDKDNESPDSIASIHDCLVGSYMSYLKAAGYSLTPSGNMHIRTRGQAIPQQISRS